MTHEIDFLEACYALRPGGDRAWLEGLVAPAEQLLAGPAALSFVAYSVDGLGAVASPWTVNADRAEELVQRGWRHPEGWMPPLNEQSTGQALRALLFSERSAGTLLVSTLPEAVSPFESDQLPPDCTEALLLSTERSTDHGIVAG